MATRISPWRRRLPRFSCRADSRITSGLMQPFAPLLLLATALLSPHGILALAAFALHNTMRIGLSVAVDLRFCWDRSMLRSLRMLPLTWFAEPLVWLAGLWGRTVVWRGRTYRLRGGRVSLAAP